jgi:hypothetical protein
LLLDVVVLVLDIVANTSQVGVLQIGVKVDLDNTVADGVEVLLLAGSRATVEDEEDRLVGLGALLLLDVLLVLVEQLGVQLDIARLVNTVDVTEASSDGEVGRDLGEGGPDLVDVLGLGVERVIVNVLVVDAVFLTTSDADFLPQLVWVAGIPRVNSPSRATASWEQPA